jgi:hypothetical protein
MRKGLGKWGNKAKTEHWGEGGKGVSEVKQGEYRFFPENFANHSNSAIDTNLLTSWIFIRIPKPDTGDPRSKFKPDLWFWGIFSYVTASVSYRSLYYLC